MRQLVDQMRGKFDCVPPTFITEMPSICCAGRPLAGDAVGVWGRIRVPSLTAPWWNVGEKTWPVGR